MEISKSEFAAIEAVVVAAKTDVAELQDLELSLVGGGCGDITLG